MTLGQVIVNNPDSYPYETDANGFYESQQYYLAWYYGTEAYDRLDNATLGHNSYLVGSLELMRRDGVDISSLTVSEMDQMSLENASRWNKIDQTALAVFAGYKLYNYAKSLPTNKVYSANGDPGLRAQRRPAFDSWIDDGIKCKWTKL